MTTLAPAFLVLTLLSSSADAGQQAIPDSVRTGMKVAVVDDRGVHVEGRVQDVTEQAVRLSVRDRSVDIPVDRIVRIERPDTVKNGAIIGLIVGLGMGAIGSAIEAEGGGVLVARTAGNGLICAGFGALLDAAVDSRQTLYQRGQGPHARIAPVIDRGIRAVAVSVSW